jgi:hypothetical protein
MVVLYSRNLRRLNDVAWAAIPLGRNANSHTHAYAYAYTHSHAHSVEQPLDAVGGGEL